jgi:glycerol-3-phosphate dehydrogenase
VDTLGPWSRDGARRLVRGSHLVLPRLTSGEHAIAYFNSDGRIVFLIPWGETRPLSLVGTTDIDHQSGPDEVAVSTAEVAYLLSVVRRLFPAAGEVRPISAYSALRPLVPEDGAAPSAVSREHRIWNSDDGVLHVAGGKYTTYRAMSEEAADLVAGELAPALARLHLTARTRLAACESAAGRGPAPQSDRIRHAVEREMARRLSDLMFVSTSWGYEQQWTRERLEPLAREMGSRLGWERGRIEQEIERVLCEAAVPG